MSEENDYTQAKLDLCNGYSFEVTNQMTIITFEQSSDSKIYINLLINNSNMTDLTDLNKLYNNNE